MSSRFSALLLAGGKSSRMRRDKALLEMNGELLWQRQLKVLRALHPHELFIAGPLRHESAVSLTDARPDCGPLGGLAAGLRHCSAPLLLVLAVDLPRMTSDYLRALLARCNEGGVVPREQPLVAIYPKKALSLADEALSAGEYSARKFAHSCLRHGLIEEVEIAPADESLFFNVNTPDDFRVMTNV